MEIKLYYGMSIGGDKFIRVDFYKSHEAFLNPETHDDEIWNCCCAFDPNDPTNPNQLNVVDRLLSIIETSVNSCLKEVLK